MAPGRNSEALGIVELALAFHRAPTQHADLLHGRATLPPGVDTLLKLAGGSEPDPGYAALAHPDELKAAALFFIEQVMFRHGVSHYRVLGVEPGASLEQIKEHHRLLMRVFHPDRETRTDDWNSAFATRINLAYTALRDPEARRQYDVGLRSAARPGKPPLPARRVAPPPRPAAPPSRTSGLPPVVQRFLPQWVLAGTALVAFVGVGAVYLNNPPAPTVHALDAARMPAPLHDAPAMETLLTAAEPPELPPEPEALPQPQPPASIPPPAPLSEPAPLPKPEPKREPKPSLEPRLASATKSLPAPTPVRAIARVQAPAPAATPAKVATRPLQHETPAVSAGATPHRSPVVPAAVPQPVEKRTAKAVASVAPTPAAESPREPPVMKSAAPEPRAAVAPARPAEPNPDATLAQFMSSYERGDTQAFMALFDEVAISGAGGKSQIRRQHESLFRSTDLRHLAVDGMAWSQDGDWIRGEGRYRKTVMPKGELRLQTETGVFRIQLLRRGEQALIMGLDYQPGGRS